MRPLLYSEVVKCHALHCTHSLMEQLLFSPPRWSCTANCGIKTVLSRDLQCSPLFLFNGLWSNESKWQVTRRALAKGNNVAPQSSLSPPVHIGNDLTHHVLVCIAGLNLAMDQHCLLKQIEVTTPRTPCDTVAVCLGLLFFCLFFFFLIYLNIYCGYSREHQDIYEPLQVINEIPQLLCVKWIGSLTQGHPFSKLPPGGDVLLVRASAVSRVCARVHAFLTHQASQVVVPLTQRSRHFPQPHRPAPVSQRCVLCATGW